MKLYNLFVNTQDMRYIKILIPAIVFFVFGCEPKVKQAETVEEAIEYIKTTYPKLVIIDPVFDFGEVEAGTIIEHTFEYKNTGVRKLQIFKADAECGCTVINDYDKDIEPDSVGRLKIIFDTTDEIGSIKKKVSLTGNTYKPIAVNAAIIGTVIAAKNSANSTE